MSNFPSVIQLAGGPTNVVLLENLMPARNMINPVERREVGLISEEGV